MEGRIRNPALRSRITSGAEAAALIKNGMTVALGGYTSSGYPKVIVRELVARKQAGEDLRLNVVSGSNNGYLDTQLAEAEILARRSPMIESKALAAQVNKGRVQYCEQQMNKMPRLIRTGAFGRIDYAVVEALAVTEDGGFIPTSSVGMVPNLVDAAENVIIEINTAVPEQLEGMHDIYRFDGGPIPILAADQRIGANHVKCDPAKIRAIVASDVPDETPTLAPVKAAQIAVSDNLLNFLELEMRRQGLRQLPPIQTGFGNLAAEIVENFGRSDFRDIAFFAGNTQEANVRLVAQGKAKSISCGSVQMTPYVTELLRTDAALREKILIRNGEVTNSSEVISRLGLIALTTGVEMDIYGNVNSSHISGTRVLNGLGGGANFAENAGLSIAMIVSENKGGAISTIVPMVSHQDICEHDIDVVITEHGVADLRGLSDVERAQAIIQNCTGVYREQLTDYLTRAQERGGHHPMLLEEALSWHIRLKEQGTMLKTD